MEIPLAKSSQVSIFRVFSDRKYVLHRFPRVSSFWCNAFNSAHCSSGILTKPEHCNGKTCAPMSRIPKRTSRACGRRALAKEKKIVSQGSSISWTCTNPWDQMGGGQGCWRAGWCHRKVTVISKRCWILEKIPYDWKNVNAGWKGGYDDPSRHIPICHLKNKNEQSPTWFDSSFPRFPVKSFQSVTGMTNCPLVIEREGN